MSQQLTPVPNPTTKFAWVPSELSGSLLAFQNISYLALGLWVWDLLIFCDYDFRLLRNSIKQARKSPRAAIIQGSTWYLLERTLTTVANILYVVYYSYDPMGNCAQTAAAFTTFYALAAASATMLLSMRVFAIWDLRKVVVIPLCILWVIVLGADLTLRWAVEGVPIVNGEGRELGCVGSIPAPYTFAGFTATLVNDAACSALVLWRVTRPDVRLPTSSKEEKKNSVINMGEGNTVTKVIKYQTIFYYTITTTSTVVALSLQKAKRLDPVAQIVWSAFNLTVQNLVASHMYRGLRAYAAPTGNTGSQGAFSDRRTSVIESISGGGQKPTHFPMQDDIEIGTRKPADYSRNGGVTMNTTTVQKIDAPSPVLSVDGKGSSSSHFSPHTVKYEGWERSPDSDPNSLSNASIDQRSHSLSSTNESPPLFYIIK